jgi:hypothetical protein
VQSFVNVMYSSFNTTKFFFLLPFLNAATKNNFMHSVLFLNDTRVRYLLIFVLFGARTKPAIIRDKRCLIKYAHLKHRQTQNHLHKL